jgi:hypothetical protein
LLGISSTGLSVDVERRELGLEESNKPAWKTEEAALIMAGLLDFANDSLIFSCSVSYLRILD